ncbi:xylose isomerase [Pedobacter yulinensis]|uniref:Xylose isomerase n=1 Tax=Pedobacter yulinensis TaxID=2126353 RepID=A0A2T3HJ88_9SPHI|nr:sugar phosphate isomerase/epimerase family protein [Pedobacter yulinensis]PST82500.1 xylose isomerase [Pedobacter yulinensis]
MNPSSESRRDFLRKAALAGGGLALGAALPFDLFAGSEKKEFFQISLAQWSLNPVLFSGKLKNMDFPEKAKKDFGIDIVEYVSPFFQKQESNPAYVKELKQRTDDLGISNHLIMVDGEGDLGNTDAAARKKAVENHYKWIDVAKALGCRTIRVNAAGRGTPDEVKSAAIEGLSMLSDYGRQNKINVIVENHGGISSNGQWLASVMKGVNSPYCGTLPDFGNFRISSTEEYDRYQGVKELMPYAKGVSAKSFDFDASGNETTIDYIKMFEIIKAARWSGIVGIEYEGSKLPPDEGIRKTKVLLEKVRGHFK